VIQSSAAVAPIRVARNVLTFVALVLALTGPASAGTVCGTVRDAQSLQPVSGAAILLFDASDAYTGLLGASAADGTWCIENVPAGVYTVQVRRDDYVMAVVTGVQVTEDVVAVDIQAVTRALLRSPWPNPASSIVRLGFRVAAGMPLQLEVLDVRGRRVRSWSGEGNGLDRTLEWDFRDSLGRPVATGIYHVALRVGDVSVVRRVTHVR
jgi:hypothetical protein